MSIKQLLRNWLLPELRNRTGNEAPPLAKAIGDQPQEIETGHALRIHINRATNGYTVQVLQYKPNPRGPDWTGELWVVPSGDDMMTVIKAGLATARLENT